MKKEINILRLFLLGTVIAVVFISIFVFFGLRNRVDYNELIEVSISNMNGLAAIYDRYTLTREDGQWIAIGEDNVCKVVDDTFVTNIKNILAENNVHKWDGFNKELTYIYDASSIDFRMRFLDGKEITASGYATYPRNFYIVFEEFEELFEELLSE